MQVSGTKLDLVKRLKPSKYEPSKSKACAPSWVSRSRSNFSEGCCAADVKEILTRVQPVADALLRGRLTPAAVQRIEVVWHRRRFFTLDHRRLAAFRLVAEQVPKCGLALMRAEWTKSCPAAAGAVPRGGGEQEAFS